MTDEIRIAGIEVFAYHGVLPTEKAEGQPFMVDVTIEADLRKAAASDALEDTVDYGALASAISDAVAGERWNLIETVADRVAELALSIDGVDAVNVTVHKPKAPLDVPFEDVSVTIRRTAS